MKLNNHYAIIKKNNGRSRLKATKLAFDCRLEAAISFYKEVIERNSQPSFNFIWTYVSTLPKITKGLFIYENLAPDAELDSIEPFLQALFFYMLNALKTIYSRYDCDRDRSALARHASRTLDMFCDAKSSAIPYRIKAMCILNTPE